VADQGGGPQLDYASGGKDARMAGCCSTRWARCRIIRLMAHALLYGGTFDPIHHGHLIACRAAREYLGADLVVLLPAWVSPHKTGAVASDEPPEALAPRAESSARTGPRGEGASAGTPMPRAGGASPSQRAAMLRVAIAEDAGVVVEERELTRGAASAGAGGEPSYTIDTVEELLRERPGDRFTLLLGADQLPLLHTWHQAARLFTMVEAAVLGRPSDRPMQAALLSVRRRLGARIADRLTLLPTPLIEISATQIRQRVREGLPIRFLVPERVAQFIAREGLYR
jgi:nicotinate-nucleotide adenylyltransferase